MAVRGERQREDAPPQASEPAPAPAAHGAAAPVAEFSAGSLSPAAVIALQRRVGNAAVAGLMRERALPGAPGGGAGAAVARVVARSPATAPPPAPGGADVRDPHEDPGFVAMKGATKSAAQTTKTHQPAVVGAESAQGAAVAPSNDVSSQAQAAQVDEMSRQQPGVFDRKAFIAAVKAAIDAAAPKNLEEVDDFKGSGKAAKVKDDVQGIVKGGKEGSEKDIKDSTKAPPDTSKATPKTVKAMVNDEPGAPPGDVGAAGAMPKARPAAQTDLSAGPDEVDAKLAEAEITDEMVEKSNEPTFTGAMQARDAAKEHSEAAPVDYRSKEQDLLSKGRSEAQDAAGAELGGMHGARKQALTKVGGQKGETKSADEQKRAKVATDIEGIYERTKTDVTGILDGLDGKVDAAFTKGEGAARAQFENHVKQRMDAYKDERYGGLLGPAKWLKDKIAGMPDEVNAFYSEGKAGYLTAMDGVIGEVADVVGSQLTAARARIVQGRADVQKYVTQLPADLKEVGKEAADKLESQFEQLSSDVDAKQDALIDTLAKKYVESRDALDARIDELKAANKGFVSKALDAVVGMVQTILKLKDMLMGVLSRAADVIGDIIKDPIGFLGNLVSGVKAGLSSFVSNIATHLKDGSMGWLFGALGDAGITMPKSLDFAGILDLVLQVLGLTYRNVRGRIAKLVGEPVVAKMEQTIDVLKDFAAKGIAGAWEWIKDKLGDLEEMVLGQIKEFVTSKIIKAGITWIISLLNPAAAFIKACKAIYDIVMWIVERGSQLMEFVNAVLDSIGAIAKGSIGTVVEKVEGALSKALPVAISFLASLLGLGGISEKIRSVIDSVRAPISKAIDFVVGGAIKAFKSMFKGAIGWAKGKYEKGKDYVKGKVDAGKAKIKGTVASVKDRLRGKPKDAQADEAKRAALNGAVGDVDAAWSAAPPKSGKSAAKAKMAEVKGRPGVSSIRFESAGVGRQRVVARVEEIKGDAHSDPAEPVSLEQFGQARDTCEQTLGRLQAYVSSKEAREKHDSKTLAGFAEELRELTTRRKNLQPDVAAVQKGKDLELAGLVLPELNEVRTAAEGLEGRIKDATAPAAGESVLGAGGVSTTSTTILKASPSRAYRLDVENPGGRAGQLHLQPKSGGKYLYDFEKNEWRDKKGGPIPPGLLKELEDDPDLARNIEKARRMLNVKDP